MIKSSKKWKTQTQIQMRKRKRKKTITPKRRLKISNLFSKKRKNKYPNQNQIQRNRKISQPLRISGKSIQATFAILTFSKITASPVQEMTQCRSWTKKRDSMARSTDWRTQSTTVCLTSMVHWLPIAVWMESSRSMIWRTKKTSLNSKAPPKKSPSSNGIKKATPCFAAQPLISTFSTVRLARHLMSSPTSATSPSGAFQMMAS